MPRYSWNVVKVGVKHQSINQPAIREITPISSKITPISSEITPISSEITPNNIVRNVYF